MLELAKINGVGRKTLDLVTTLNKICTPFLTLIATSSAHNVE